MNGILAKLVNPLVYYKEWIDFILTHFDSWFVELPQSALAFVRYSLYFSALVAIDFQLHIKLISS